MQDIDLHVMYPRLCFKGQLSESDNYSDGGVMKKGYLFILMLLVLILAGCSMSNGFNGNVWGSSIDSVKRREGLPNEENIATLSYDNKKVLNAEADISYLFSSNKLHSIFAVYKNLNSFEYLHILSELSKTYGEKYDITESERNGGSGLLASFYGGRVSEAYGWTKGKTVVTLVSVTNRNGGGHVELQVKQVR